MDKNDLRGSLLALDEQLLGQRQANAVLTLLNSAISDPKSYVHCQTVQDTLLHFATIASILVYLSHLKLATPPNRFPTMLQIKAGLSLDDASFLLSFPLVPRILPYLDEREHLLNAFRSSVFSHYVEKCLTERTYKATSIADIKLELLSKASLHAQKKPDAISLRIHAFQAVIGSIDTTEQQEDERIYSNVISGSYSRPLLPTSFPLSSSSIVDMTITNDLTASTSAYNQHDRFRNQNGACNICALSASRLFKKKAHSHNPVDCYHLALLASQDDTAIQLSGFPTALRASLPPYSKLLSMRINNQPICSKRKHPSNPEHFTIEQLQSLSAATPALASCNQLRPLPSAVVSCSQLRPLLPALPS